MCNDAQESSSKELSRMFSSKTLLNCIYWTMPFTVHTYASDKQVGTIISNNNKPIAFF